MLDEKIENKPEEINQDHNLQKIEETPQPQQSVDEKNKDLKQAPPKTTQVIVQSKWPLLIGVIVVVITTLAVAAFLLLPKLLIENNTNFPLLTPIASDTAVFQATNSAATKSASILTQNCTNSQYDYSVEYPITWFTTQRSDKERCQFFGSTVFSFPKAWDGQLTTITITPVDIKDWDKTKSAIASSSAALKIVDNLKIRMGNNQVVKINTEYLSGGLTEAGLVGLSYLIDHPKTPVVISLKPTKADNSELSTNQKIIENLVKSFRFL